MIQNSSIVYISIASLQSIGEGIRSFITVIAVIIAVGIFGFIMEAMFPKFCKLLETLMDIFAVIGAVCIIAVGIAANNLLVAGGGAAFLVLVYFASDTFRSSRRTINPTLPKSVLVWVSVTDELVLSLSKNRHLRANRVSHVTELGESRVKIMRPNSESSIVAEQFLPMPKTVRQFQITLYRKAKAKQQHYHEHTKHSTS